eukprot:c11036_g1_i1.p1 GENE.c11036_g1_i1~~c11036_g1_i1.p1  ORF type:complete len:100 (+),score=30.35 c11036_g1_i1:40-339(+)
MASRLIPLADRILVKRVAQELKTAGGILLPESANASKMNKGKVVAVGPGNRNREGVFVPLSVKPDDVVLLPDYAGAKVKLGEEELSFYREDDIIAIIKE